MKRQIITLTKFGALLLLCSGIAGCDDMRVYGSVGVSSFHGNSWGGSGSGLSTSVTVGGRIR